MGVNISNLSLLHCFSLLHSLDPGTATADQLKEAFCRLVFSEKGQLSAICLQHSSAAVE